MSTSSRPNRTVTTRLSQLAAASLVSFASAQVAHAHISVEMGGTHQSRAGDGELKEGPCGVADAPRGSMVYKYKPGATINVSVAETIPHPGYFRISFDSDGVDGFVDPSGTSGEGGDCVGDANCGAGKEDYCSNETVLLDALDQHDGGGGKTYTWSVKLPNVECANCTLQVIQVMNDLNFHPGAFPAGDIYYACIDIELSNSAPDVTDTPVTNNGMTCAPATDPGAAGSGAAGSAAAGSGAAGSGAAGSAGSGAAGSSAGAAGASGSAGTAPAAGSAAAPSGGSAGSRPTSPTTSTAGASGRPATGAAGSTPSTSGMMNSQNAAGSAAPAAPASSEGSGGCQAAPASSFGLFGPLALAFLALTWRRRSLVQATSRRFEHRN